MSKIIDIFSSRSRQGSVDTDERKESTSMAKGAVVGP